MSIDLLLYNGTVWTVNPAQPWAGAIAISGEKISAVESGGDIEKLLGSATEAIDLQGAFVLPGFIDGHAHFLNGGYALSGIQLFETTNREEFVAKIKERADSLEKGKWILNGDWDYQKFDPPRLPHRDWIDPVTPDNPVCINCHDCHMVLVNTAALRMAGITKETLPPEGGEILKDSLTGEPTGILKDGAMTLMTGHIPEYGLDEQVEAAAAALDLAGRMGVTTLHDMSFEDSAKALEKLFESNRLTAQIHGYLPLSRYKDFSPIVSHIPPAQSSLTLGGLKGFVDGSLGSATACLFKPYSDNPLTSGLLAPEMFPDGEMETRIHAADKQGLQLAVHAIGDRANHIILDIFEKVIKKNGARDRRWRIEHAQHLIPEDMNRLADLGIIASMQPYHAIDDGRWMATKIGQERSRHSFAFKSLLEKKAVLVFGSDWTVAPMNPLMGIYAAITRRTLDGKNPQGWFPEQKISLEAAIQNYTINGAYAEFAEDKKGSIKKGKFADIVVLSDNLFEIPASAIPRTKVLTTLVRGEIVYKE